MKENGCSDPVSSRGGAPKRCGDPAYDTALLLELFFNLLFMSQRAPKAAEGSRRHCPTLRCRPSSSSECNTFLVTE